MTQPKRRKTILAGGLCALTLLATPQNARRAARRAARCPLRSIATGSISPPAKANSRCPSARLIARCCPLFDVRFDSESNQVRATQYVAMGHVWTPQRRCNCRHVSEGSGRHWQSALREDALDPDQYERASPRTILKPILRAGL